MLAAGFAAGVAVHGRQQIVTATVVRQPSGAGLSTIQQRAAAAGAGLRRMRVHGGTLELVLQPKDPRTFVADAGSELGRILSPAGFARSIVTVVDHAGTVVFRLDAGGAHGSAYLAPGYASDAILGTPAAVSPGAGTPG